MAATPATGLTFPATKARRFGLEIGGGMAVAALLLGRRATTPVLAGALGAVGALLLVVAVVRPTLLAPVARRWMWLGTRIASVTSPAVLTVVYLVVLAPAAWLRRTVGRSPILRSPASPTYWVRRPGRSPADARAALERQF